MIDPKHLPADRVRASSRPKTMSCLWCGLSEAMGAILVMRPAVGPQPKAECIDKAACENYISRRIKGLS